MLGHGAGIVLVELRDIRSCAVLLVALALATSNATKGKRCGACAPKAALVRQGQMPR